MKQGKGTCRILKDIRRQIAEAYDIEYITSECQYKDDCMGACHKSEAEDRYLEQQPKHRRMAGKAITVLGISAGLATLIPQTANGNPAFQDSHYVQCDTLIDDSTEVMGKVFNDPETVVGDSIYATTLENWPDSMPEFPGGMQELIHTLAKKINYPPQQGNFSSAMRVAVRFIIEKDGSITNPEVIRGINPELDKEALRVVNELPAWKPGTVKGVPVRVQYTIPIMFRLQ